MRTISPMVRNSTVDTASMKGGDLLALLAADQRQAGAENRDREEQDLQHVVARPGASNRGARDDVEQEAADAAALQACGALSA